MPIEYRRGDIFASKADWLVAPVNCVGVMGAGLAKQFKLKIPGLEDRYKAVCREQLIAPGEPFRLFMNDGSPHIVLFPTKNHWRNPSKLEWIDRGLLEFAHTFRNATRIQIAVPPLGCGLGGLHWDDVKPLIEKHLGSLEVTVLVYEPGPIKRS